MDKNINKNIIKSKNNIPCIGPVYPPNTLFYHPQTNITIKSNSAVCPVDVSYKKNNDIDDCDVSKQNIDFINYEKQFINNISVSPENYKDFLHFLYNIKTFYDSDNFLSNNISLNHISKSRVINAIYKVFKLNPEFPSDIYCSNIKDILFITKNIDISTSKIKQKIVINKNKKTWHNIFQFFIFNYSN